LRREEQIVEGAAADEIGKRRHEQD
jgi:hypothetical protein